MHTLWSRKYLVYFLFVALLPININSAEKGMQCKNGNWWWVQRNGKVKSFLMLKFSTKNKSKKDEKSANQSMHNIL